MKNKYHPISSGLMITCINDSHFCDEIYIKGQEYGIVDRITGVNSTSSVAYSKIIDIFRIPTIQSNV